MPRVWSTIVIKGGGMVSIPRLETIATKWTSSTAIDLHFECNDYEEQSKHVAKLLLPFRSQIRILHHLCIYDSNCLLPFLFGHGDPISLPLLKSLHIESDGLTLGSINGRENYIDAPNLVRLCLKGTFASFELAFTKRSLSRVQHLSIHHCYTRNAISPPALALSSSSLLSLKWFTHYAVPPRLSFPNIVEMKLCRPYTYPNNWDLLDLFDAPKLEALTIKLDSDESDSDSDSDSTNSPLLIGCMTSRNFTNLIWLHISSFGIDHIVVDQITKACPKLKELVFSQCQVVSFLVDEEDNYLSETGIRWIIFEHGEISEGVLRTLLDILADEEKLQPDDVEPRITVRRVIYERRHRERYEIKQLEKEFPAIFQAILPAKLNRKMWT
ncbi:hypothetical protein M422DRAFT_783679 [Sphaerobolus stellatus SS14]|uniref:F-box domain-containing protein n=1 Tax=Sphaerobolus stellatus (strain SS14) TaxID=990650 RepID=A0A0C9URI5_SPHS4|nr:hypothetical protein M422DRAFT_783679 [Sphaerobolus stellatus SS14]